MDIKKLIQSWPVYRQLTGDDPLGRGEAAQSARSARLTPRTAEADPSRIRCARTARSGARRRCT